MGRSKTPEATAAKISASLRHRRLTEEHRAKISAANKGRELTAEERHIRSCVAKVQCRGDKLNARIAADPVQAAARRERSRRLMANLNAKRWGKPAPETPRSDVEPT